MFPLKDDNPTSTFPIITISLIFANILVFLYQLSLGPALESFIFRMGIIPYEITHFADLEPVNNFPIIVNFFSSMFMHGGFIHIIGNMWCLWLFGDNIEDYMGHFKFLLFYLLCGFFADLTHIFFNFNSKVPTIGASGAIAGVMGAYILLYPKSKVYTLFFIFFFIRVIPIPAVLFIGIWIFIQIMSGLQTIGVSQLTGVAWFAHIGGFGAGIALLYLLGSKGVKRRRRQKYHDIFYRG